MINYLVDASIYGLPECIPDTPNDELIKSYDNYLENLNTLMKHISPQEISRSSINYFLKVNRFLFSNKDIIFLENEKLLLDKTNKEKLLKIVKSNQKYRIHDLQSLLIDSISKLKRYKVPVKNNTEYSQNESPKPGRLRILEEYIGVDNLDVKINKPCVPDLKNEIKNDVIMENLNKNLCLLAFLNKYVYKSSDITSIITTSNEERFKLDINIENIKKHEFTNIPPSRIWISNGFVKNTNIKNIKTINYSSIRQVLKAIKSNNVFKDTIKFSNSVNESIEEYENILLDLTREGGKDIKKDIDFFITEYSNTLMNCLIVLDNLVKYYHATGVSEPPRAISKNFFCRSVQNNDVCKICCGYLRLCGYACSGENTERVIGDDVYVIHLKPYTYSIEGNEKHLRDLTLRIYFKWDEDKIKVGWIGKHF